MLAFLLGTSKRNHFAAIGDLKKLAIGKILFLLSLPLIVDFLLCLAYHNAGF